MRVPGLTSLIVVAVVAGSATPATAASDEIAYGCNSDICLVNPATPGTSTNLTDNGATSVEDFPAWSHDGTRLAFVSTYPAGLGGVRNIFAMDPDAQGQAINLATQITPYTVAGDYITDPVYSPDGTKLAYEYKSSLNGSVGVYVVAADGSTVTPVTIAAIGEHPTWSPDSTRIAFSHGEQVYLANADGSSGASPPALANAPGHDPAWSPDGTRIAFDTIDPVGHAPLVDLSIAGASGAGTPILTTIHFTQWTFAAWSPDATRVAYRATNINDGYIRVVDGDGSQDHGLAGTVNVNDHTPSWSPDGTQVTFDGYHYSPTDPSVNDNEIYIANTDGSGSQLVITTGGKNAHPTWRPDPSRAPFVPILTPPAPVTTIPAPVPGAPLPGPTQKPKVVWITKRIPYTPGPDPSLRIGSYGCGGPRCSVATTGTARYAAPPSTVRAASAAANKPAHHTPRPKTRTIVVARGHMTVPSGATRPLTMKLTSAGIALLKRAGNLTITVTVVTTGAGRTRETNTRTVHVTYVKPARHAHRKH